MYNTLISLHPIKNYNEICMQSLYDAIPSNHHRSGKCWLHHTILPLQGGMMARKVMNWNYGHHLEVWYLHDQWKLWDRIHIVHQPYCYCITILRTRAKTSCQLLTFNVKAIVVGNASEIMDTVLLWPTFSEKPITQHSMYPQTNYADDYFYAS